MNYKERYASYLELIEPALAECFGKNKRGFYFDGLLDAMDYSLMAGGKRIRPVLTLEFSRACGGDIGDTLPVACAVELLHTYSLIHDDLPAMDNDDLRRGKPTNHRVFGECNAILAGDALQAEAFGKILRSDLSSERRAACAEALADAAGIDGICGGQYMDMNHGGGKITEEELTELQSHKTDSLIIAACRMGVFAAGGGEELEELACQYGAALGSAFQIRDDILDEIASVEELGKPIGSDVKEGKTTFMTLYGRQKCEKMVEALTERAKTVANSLPDGEFLAALADELSKRNY